MPRVFIPNVPTRFDPLMEDRVPSLDLRKATEFGTLVELSDRVTRVTTHTVDWLASQIKERIEAADYDQDDFLICVGDPALIGAAFHYIGSRWGRINLLRWDKIQNEYQLLEIKL